MKGSAKVKTEVRAPDAEVQDSEESSTVDADHTWTATSDNVTHPALDVDAAGNGKPMKGGGGAESAHIKEIRASEDLSLRDLLDQIGSDGSFRISLYRDTPEEWEDPKTGKRVQTKGKLKTYTQKIDEDMISARHGGGRYTLRIFRKNTKGSYNFFTQRTIDIAGDPRVDDVPRTSALPSAPLAMAQVGESPAMVKEAFSIMREQLDRADRKEPPAVPRGIDPAVQMMLEQLREDGRRREDELHELRRELAQQRNTKPPEDPIKDKILGSLIDGESGRIVALRQQHESELRQTKEFSIEDQRRREDRHERDMATLKSSYDREIAAMKSSHENTLLAARQSHEMQIKVLDSDIRRLERENERIAKEVTDLRAKKDKSLIEQVKEIQSVKDALGLDEGDGDKSGVDKVLEILGSPAAGELLSRFTSSGGASSPPPPHAQPAVAAGQAAPQRQPTLVQTQAGKRLWLMPNGQVRDAKKKPKVIPATVNPDGTVATPEIQLPDVDPAAVALVVGFLERAYASNQEPEIVAQSQRSTVPAEILSWIREHDTEAVSGVDLFMSKVAKLPGSSQLATQRGKNWLRRVGKALSD